MKYSTVVLLLVFAKHGTSSFVLPRESSRLSKKTSPGRTPKVFQLRQEKHHKLPASSTAAANGVKKDDIIPASIAVGVITAAMGFLYGKVLGLSVTTIWSTIPNLLLEKTGSINPRIFITSTCTIGGLIMGLLTSKLSSTFAVSDFVSAFSRVPAETLPSPLIHLGPLLLLSLVTSSFGFSVGPEAPMVCAGALLVVALVCRKWKFRVGTRRVQYSAHGRLCHFRSGGPSIRCRVTIWKWTYSSWDKGRSLFIPFSSMGNN